MTPNLFEADGKPIRLSERLGKGGEGEVYALDGNNGLAVKYYTVHDAHTREAKIRCMVAEQLSAKSPLVAFPMALVFDKARKFVGFVMARISGHQPLHELYSPGARRAAFPQANYRFLVMCAGNIARAIGMTHASGCVVGDINHSGVLVSPKAKVTLIDADSFQVSDGSKHYLCKVGVPEYTPPELQGLPLGGIVRTPNHDAFGLAVVVFQLLFMGRHPFSGRPATGDIPLEKAIGEYRFAYSTRRSVGLQPPPGVPTLRDFPPAIGAAFEAAFSPDGRQSRPTATQWIELLNELKDSLRVCAVSNLHHYPAAASECPWCRMEKRYAVPLFIPVLPTFDANATFTPTLGDVLEIWRAIETVRPPVTRQFPQFSGSAPAPSAKMAELAKTRFLKRWGGWALLAGAAVLVLNVQGAVLPAILIGAAGWWLSASKSSGDEEAVQNFRGTQTRIYQAEAEWQGQNDGIEFVALKSELKRKKEAYEALPREQTESLNDYARNRRALQLKSYLDSFLIRQFKIPKVGPGRQAVLLSYGIETAGDITEVAVLKVPGFGPKTSQPLLNWRRHMESRFVYNAAPTSADSAATNVIRADIAQKAAKLKLELSVGPAKLAQLSAAIGARQNASLPFIETLLRQHAQSVGDLKTLGIGPPVVPRPPPIQRSPPAAFPRQATGQTASVSATGTVSAGQSVGCPKCGGNMVIRLAMKGRHRGNKFYGCTRYPSCNGTRSFP